MNVALAPHRLVRRRKGRGREEEVLEALIAGKEGEENDGEKGKKLR